MCCRALRDPELATSQPTATSTPHHRDIPSSAGIRMLGAAILLITAVVLATATCAGRGAQTSPIRFETQEGTQLAFDISPDGQTIVFDLLGQIWTLPSAGGRATPLTSAVADTADDTDPVFSPDGRAIVFWSDRGAGVGLWLMRLGRPPRLLTEGRDPSWSPDGRQLVLSRGNAIYVVDVASGEARKLDVDSVPSDYVRDPAWSPDGQWIVLANTYRLNAAGAPLWEVPSRGGIARRVTADTVPALHPAYSPDGKHIAFFSQDSIGQYQMFVLDRAGQQLTQLTSHRDVAARRVRWSPDGEWLYYSADGRLWRTHLRDRLKQEIPFRAVVRLDRNSAPVHPVQFANPGSTLPARGNMGLALSPSGTQVALIALNRLWVFSVGAQPKEVVKLPLGAYGAAWSPDETTVLWSGGPAGGEDLYATDITTGHTRQITALPGREDRPAWSPDGKWIAFLHWEWPEVADPPWQGFAYDTYLRVIPAKGPPVSKVSETIDLGDLDYRYTADLYDWCQEAPRWVPGSDRLLVFAYDGRGEVTTISLAGEDRPVGSLPPGASFVHFAAHGALVFVEGNALWRVRFDPDSGVVGEPEALSDEAAFDVSTSRDGAILYLSEDGYVLRRPNGSVQRLGWPLTFEVPTPEPLLVRNARVIVGNGEVLSGLRDIRVDAGRITAIAPSGRLAPEASSRVVDAGGRTVMPGLIDAHSHLDDEVSPVALLYHGITTVRDMGAELTRVAGMRDAIDAGVRPGARVVFGGVRINPGQPPDGLSGQSLQSPSDPEAMQRTLAVLEALGANSVKMRLYGRLGPGAAMVRASRDAGFPISGHCAQELAFVAAGMSGKEHLGPSCGVRSDDVLYDDVAQLFRAAGMWVVPTLSDWSAQIAIMEDTTRVHGAGIGGFLTPYGHFWLLRIRPSSARRYHSYLDRARAATKGLYQRGVRVATGTDIPWIPTAIHTEVEEFVALGMTPLEAITAATADAALVLAADGEIGSIEEGKWADLVILDADPLEDIRNTRKIWMLIKGGEVVDREALLAQYGARNRN